MHRDRRTQPRNPPRFAIGRMQPRFHQARRDSVHANAFGGHFARQSDGEGVYRGLRRRVRHPFARAAGSCRDRGDIHDGAARSAPPRRHPSHSFTRAQNRSCDVHGQHLGNRSAAGVFHAGESAGDGRVVDQRAYGSQLALGGFKEAQNVGFGRNVRLDRNRSRLQAGHHALSRGGIVRVIHRDRIPV